MKLHIISDENCLSFEISVGDFKLFFRGMMRAPFSFTRLKQRCVGFPKYDQVWGQIVRVNHTELVLWK